MAQDTRWYVIHTYSGYENKVAVNIEKMVENREMQDQIQEVRVPTEWVTEVKDGKERLVERKVYPSYVLVKCAVRTDTGGRLKMSDSAWYVIRNTRGVTGFVGPDSKAAPLTEEDVAAMGIERRSVELTYAVGDMVSITDPTFEGVIGTVESIDLENKIVDVAVTGAFGKASKFTLAINQVEPLGY
ncbi:MAG: transcription termination/antitermination protein NusG [Oscillospiraceae bacterium]|jgi:transcriptional antiterminator NusG|nr:transcription termination/antitermination protein NusG [Oscillospiraceae bacterium]